MHLWLFEPDGDAWMAQITDGGRSVGGMSPGWRHLTIPVGSLRFDPRGAKTRGMVMTSKLLLGCNFGDLEVTVDNLRLITRGEVLAWVEPRTEPLAYAAGPAGTVAILSEEFPPLPGSSDPSALRALLTEAGWGVTLLRAGDLKAEGVLTREHFDALILPYGPLYPASAGAAIQAYLKAGGGLVNLGGYAFDRPLAYAGTRWEDADAGRTAAEMDAGGQVRSLNTRQGTAGDTMGFSPDQIQLFDPAFTLARADALQVRVPTVMGSGRIATGPLEGYSAVSTLGSHSPVFPVIWGRRIPLVTAEGPTGLRGAAGAAVYNHAGPYAGSAWVVFGVTNRDLFTAPDAPLAAFLAGYVERAAHPCAITHARTEYACYRPGEEIVVRGAVMLPAGTADARIAVSLGDLPQQEVEPGPPGAMERVPRPFEARFPAPALAGGTHAVRVSLTRSGRPADRLETGVVVWDPGIVANGPQPTIEGSYFAVNGKKTVLSGTNETGFVWFSEHEDPLVWEQDFRAMADHGVNVLRLLHFSPFSEGGYEGKPSNRPQGLANRPEALCRATDALVQIAQEHGIILFLSLHDWMDVGLSDADLAAQREWNRFWATRYRDVPGIIYDIQNEPSIGDPTGVADLAPLYNRQLAERYGDAAALQAAWGVEQLPGAWGAAPVQRGTEAWGDAQASDYQRWKLEVFRRWTMANYEATREGDADALVTVGFLPFNSAADIQSGARGMDFTNFHFYGAPTWLPRMLPFLDRRWEGSPLSIGEFGAQEAHQNRNAGLDGTRDAESIRRFVWTGHHLLGRGGSFLANWSWKDFEGAVFPWGIRYLQDPVSKDVLLAYRAQSLLFRLIEPVYENPRLFVVLPDSHRFGSAYGMMDGALQNTFGAVTTLGEPFGVIGEWELDRLPPSADALLWPMPYCPSDATFDRVVSFVEAGGALYLSGDVAFDETRKPTRADRRARLGLPDLGAPTPPGEAPEAAAEAAPVTARLGQGSVFFVPFPVESRAAGRLLGLYRAFLTQAGGEPATPAEPPAHVYRIASEGGGHVDVLARGEEQGTQTVSASGYQAELGSLECALLSLDASGGLTACHARSLTDPAGKPVISGSVEWMVGSLDRQPLAASEAAVLAPLNAGESVLDVLPGVASAPLTVGEFADGAWVTRETRTLAREPDGWRIAVSESDALSLMILCEPEGLEAAIQRLSDLLYLRPGR